MNNNNSDSILFSIVIPTYNRASLIKNTIESVINQTYQNLEVIIVDDGSADNTEEIIKTIPDKRVKYFKKINEERGAARNYGAKLAKGEYINFVDSDDILYSNHLSTAYEFVEDHNKPEIFHLGYEILTPQNKLIKRVDNLKGDIGEKLIKDNFLSPIGVFVRKDIALQFPFEHDRRLAVTEDWELWLRLASRFTILYSNEVTSKVMDHDERSIRNYDIDKIITRDLLLIEKLKKDEAFVKKYKLQVPYFEADRYTFFALLLALKKKRVESIKYLLRAFYIDPSVLMRKRFLASVKHILL